MLYFICILVGAVVSIVGMKIGMKRKGIPVDFIIKEAKRLDRILVVDYENDDALVVVATGKRDIEKLQRQVEGPQPFEVIYEYEGSKEVNI